MIIRTIWQVGTSFIRNLWLKLLRGNAYNCTWLNSCSFDTTIRLYRGGRLTIGEHLSSQKGLLIAVLPKGEMIIGNNVNINSDCFFVAREKVTIGDNVIFGPCCKIYDHDHNYKKKGKERRTSFVTGTVDIGNGTWLGANCIVLRDTKIGENCVFGAGSVIKGYYPDNSLVIQERIEKIKTINFEK